MNPAPDRAHWAVSTTGSPSVTGASARGGRVGPGVRTLLAMDWERPEHRRILELEGLRRWVRPELDGYAGLFAAVEEQGVTKWW